MFTLISKLFKKLEFRFSGNIIGIFGGFLISTERLGFNPTFYIESSIRYIEISDIIQAL